MKAKALEVLPGSNEDYQDMLERSFKFKGETLSKVEADSPILVMTHSGMINALKSDHVTEKGKLNNGSRVELVSMHTIKV